MLVSSSHLASFSSSRLQGIFWPVRPPEWKIALPCLTVMNLKKSLQISSKMIQYVLLFAVTCSRHRDDSRSNLNLDLDLWSTGATTMLGKIGNPGNGPIHSSISVQIGYITYHTTTTRVSKPGPQAMHTELSTGHRQTDTL